MIELNNDFEIRCNKCGTINTVESIKISPFRERNKKGKTKFSLRSAFVCFMIAPWTTGVKFDVIRSQSWSF